jgi:hypothetical protein
VSELGHIGGEVRRELGRFGPAAGMAELVAAWPPAVGPQIADQAWPARLARDGTLHVAVSSSVWAFELTQLESEIRTRLTAAVGELAPARIRFAVGRIPETGSDPEPEAKRSEPKVSAEQFAEGERVASGIADPHLREAVAKAVAASLADARKAP